MAVGVLRDNLQRQADTRLRAGVLWQDSGLVFTTAHGTQLDAADVRQSLRTICRRAGLDEQWTPRELRHTFVSLLSDNGMAIEEISRLVGHSSSNVTETVYRHQIRPAIAVGADAMDKSSTSSRVPHSCSSWLIQYRPARGLHHGISRDRFEAVTRGRRLDRIGSSARPPSPRRRQGRPEGG
jgi:hypothetical protein